MKNYIFFITIGCLLLLSSKQSFAQLDAEYTANTTIGCGSAIVSFTDQSLGSPTSWEWNFGDGTVFSFQQNPIHFYATPGTYTVSLKATNNTGSNTETKINYITIFSGPSANFSEPDSTGCLPFNVSFSDATILGGGAIVSWIWDFGDGGVSNSANPTYTYNSIGTYPVSLTVIDVNGCQNIITKPNHIAVSASPASSFSQDISQSCLDPLNVTFTNNSTGTGLIYAWTFGNGNTSILSTPPIQTYSSVGAYSNSLIVTNIDGCSDTSIQTVTISSFVANFGQDTTSICPGGSIVFSDLTTNTVTGWNWNFGDGGTSIVQHPTHTYNTAGIYTVQLIGTNAFGCVDTLTLNNLITVNLTPTAMFSANDSSACMVPFGVTFTDLSVGATSWNWNFGNGNTSVAQNPLNIYNTLGSFNVSLTISDINGCSATATYNSLIDIVPPNVAFNKNKSSGCAPLTVNFTDVSFSNQTITNWYWDFGNGDTSTTQNPSVTYLDTGSYTVTLIIVNSEGCTDTLTKFNTIKVGQKPIVNFSPIDTAVCFPLPIHFFDNSSPYTNQWHWNFGDNGTSNSQNPTHAYADTGYFNVTLAAGFNGCWDTLRIDSVVQVLLPKAQFTAIPLIGCDAPHTVTFTDISEGPDTWIWRFGDGLEFFAQNPPPHVYNTPGFYTVRLIVTNNTTGCADSTTKTVSISDRILGFDQSDTVGCTALSINFTDTSTVNTSISSWNWNFGDGGTSTAQNPNHIYTVGGVYDVTLIINDALGCIDTITKTNWIDAKPSPVSNFGADFTFGCAPLFVNFSDSSTGVNPITAWAWTFGDGGTDTIQNPAYNYNGTGVFNVNLTVTDIFGCTDIETKISYIKPTMPLPSFTFTPILCNADSLLFTNTSTGSGMTYVWNFGDGTAISNLTSPYHTYNLISDTTTILPVMLVVTDSNGCDSTLTQNVTVSIPYASFVADSSLGNCPPLVVNFIDSSSTDVTNWTWNFGDNSTASNLQDPAHTYTQVGVYDVSLIVNNNIGCIDTLQIDSFITVNGPVGTYSYYTLPYTCFSGVVFESNTINTDSIFFIFGDGGGASGDTVTNHFALSGIYNTVMAMFDSSGCQVNVAGIPLIIPIKVIDANFEIEAHTCSIEPFIFTDLSTSAAPLINWWWDFGDETSLLNSTNNPVKHNYTTSGLISTYLVVTDSNQCTDTANVTIDIPEVLDVTNIFTPNHDDINDLFEVISCGMVEYNIEIFNRWGMLVFNAVATKLHWDGRTNAGIETPPGTYFYVLKATSESGIVYDKKGSLTLLR